MTKNLIRTKPEPLCKCCNSEGTYLYQSLKDRLFGVEGEWHLKKCNNKQCGLIWQDPMPLEEDIGMAYQTYYTHQDNLPTKKANFIKRVLKAVYSKAKCGYLFKKYQYHAEKINLLDLLLGYIFYLHPGHRAAIDSEVFYLKAQPNGRLLEIGFGSGVALKNMQEKEWNVEGIDFDPNAVKNAINKGLKVNLGGLIEQNYSDNLFDVIVMSHVIEHIFDPVKITREINRILKKGGILIMITPNTNSFGHKIYASNYLHLDPPRHLNLFNKYSLLNLLNSNGFDQAEITSSVRGSNAVLIASNLLKKNGIYRMDGAVTLRKRLWGEIMHYLEWALHKIDKNIGEELVVKAIK